MEIIDFINDKLNLNDKQNFSNERKQIILKLVIKMKILLNLLFFFVMNI